MIRRFVTSVLFLSLLAWNASAQPAAPSADDTAKRAIDVLAGPSWEKARYLAFTFNVEHEGKIVVSFPQRWDRWTGDYRVSGKDREGHDFLVIMNINTKQGHGWKDGVEVQDPKDLLTTGYRRFINDTYWLLMPLKMLDPGVKREAAGERTDSCGNAWDLVKLSFDAGVGLTPGDQYWAWVNHNTGLVEEWDLLLQGSKPEDKPTPVKFYDFRRIGGLLISTKREIVGKNQWIKLDDVSVLSDVPKGAFEK